MAVEQINGSGGSSAPVSLSAQASTAGRSAGALRATQGTSISDAKAVQPTAAAPSTDEVRDAIQQIEQAILPSAQGLRFSIDEDSGTTVVKLIDTETQTVLRQMPSVEALEISKALGKLQGLLVKEKA